MADHLKLQFKRYQNLIWMLAVTDFKLRYQGSVLGYIWALLQPLLFFIVLNFVFSSIFASDGSVQYYSLQLIVSLMIFLFFAEATTAGMNSLVNKSQLVTKIYVPRWIIILSSTLNASIIFLMNLIVIVGFFVWYKFLPSFAAIGTFVLLMIALSFVIVGFSLIAAPLYVRFRDVMMIWDVLLKVLMYLSPILYPLSVLPEKYHTILLMNPLSFIIHFNKEALINNHFAELWQYVAFGLIVLVIFVSGILLYRVQIKGIAENI